MSDDRFRDWPFFADRHRDLAARLEAWCGAQLPVDHDDSDAASRGLVAALGRASGCARPEPAQGSGWISAR
ncbi:hypothetical protein [Defluviimonas sp. WL0075]|uniref:Acyl-CoA dehydrogenase n=1 Tax=Albidovulum sediminicola TaxID=2984331 RepID=A0ABT2Z4C5_9RHOB|nr:hypothetical protein [Defluviimonas sp. WL0075]MCV2865870.1 hypothetical protein [Defluviimonas sp. WL0075]